MSEKPLTTGAVREMRGFLRAIVRYGYVTIAVDETGICFYCGADTEYTKSPRHGPKCLYVRAKELLAKYPATHA